MDVLNGKTLLIFGATGFLGKVAVEKLLWSQSPAKVFLLVRKDKKESSQARWEELLTSICFQRVQTHQLHKLQCIEAVDGDLETPGIFASPADKARVQKEVDIVINIAASVSFKDTFRKTFTTNSLSVIYLLQFIQTCHKRPPFTHVSTTYVHPTTKWNEKAAGAQQCLEEPVVFTGVTKANLDTLYRDPSMWTGSLASWETASEDVTFINEYTKTKAMGEYFLNFCPHGLRYAIVRVSILSPSALEPEPGFIDCLQASGGITLAVGQQLMSFLNMRSNHAFDMLPVDLGANAVLVASAHLLCADALLSPSSTSSSSTSLSLLAADPSSTCPLASPVSSSSSSVSAASSTSAREALGLLRPKSYPIFQISCSNDAPILSRWYSHQSRAYFYKHKLSILYPLSLPFVVLPHHLYWSHLHAMTAAHAKLRSVFPDNKALKKVGMILSFKTQASFAGQHNLVVHNTNTIALGRSLTSERERLLYPMRHVGFDKQYLMDVFLYGYHRHLLHGPSSLKPPVYASYPGNVVRIPAGKIGLGENQLKQEAGQRAKL